MQTSASRPLFCLPHGAKEELRKGHQEEKVFRRILEGPQEGSSYSEQHGRIIQGVSYGNVQRWEEIYLFGTDRVCIVVGKMERENRQAQSSWQWLAHGRSDCVLRSLRRKDLGKEGMDLFLCFKR